MVESFIGEDQEFVMVGKVVACGPLVDGVKLLSGVMASQDEEAQTEQAVRDT